MEPPRTQSTRLTEVPEATVARSGEPPSSPFACSTEPHRCGGLGTLAAMAPRSAAARLVLAAVAVLAIVGMHGSGAEAHSCRDAHEAPAGNAAQHDHHKQGTPGEAPVAHCGAIACTAIVTSATAPAPFPLSHPAVLRPRSSEPLAVAAVAPEPPVPRPLLHV